MATAAAHSAGATAKITLSTVTLFLRKMALTIPGASTSRAWTVLLEISAPLPTECASKLVSLPAALKSTEPVQTAKNTTPLLVRVKSSRKVIKPITAIRK